MNHNYQYNLLIIQKRQEFTYFQCNLSLIHPLHYGMNYQILRKKKYLKQNFRL